MRINMKFEKKKLYWGVALILCALACAELAARYCLGLGSPPLSIVHPRIEYMFKPNQDLYRFGNHIIINQYGMRTDPFSPKKTRDEYRVMVFGDSVVNGGAQTDHADLATTKLQAKLVEEMGKPVIVGNISAGSWGPGNWLAYVKEYGYFDADVVILVVSSHDYADNPTFEALNKSTHPTDNPPSALFEGITRYLPRYMPNFAALTTLNENDHFPINRTDHEVSRGLGDLKEFLGLALANSENVVVFQHWEKSEIERGGPGIGNERISELCKSIGVETVSLEARFRQSLLNGQDPYRDNIHPNLIGQSLIYNSLFDYLHVRLGM